jgi:hypothetical protein
MKSVLDFIERFSKMTGKRAIRNALHAVFCKEHCVQLFVRHPATARPPQHCRIRPTCRKLRPLSELAHPGRGLLLAGPNLQHGPNIAPMRNQSLGPRAYPASSTMVTRRLLPLYRGPMAAVLRSMLKELLLARQSRSSPLSCPACDRTIPISDVSAVRAAIASSRRMDETALLRR